MNVYLNDVIVPWPVDWHEGPNGWVDVWMTLQHESWMAFNLEGVLYRLHGNVTIVTVLAKPVWLP